MHTCLGSRRLLAVSVVLALSVTSAPAHQTQPAGVTGAPAPGQRTPPRGTPPGEDATKGTATMRGIVVAADTGTPLRRVQIRAMAANPPDHVTTTTDDQGRFELKELLGGRYTLLASRNGFVPLQYGQRRPSERGTPVDLAPGGVVEKLTIALPRGGVIAGRVLDDRGEPLGGARVQALRATFGPRGRQMLPTGPGDTTDDLGGFRIYGLAPGAYVVSASWVEFGMFAPGTRSQDDGQGFAPTYFPGAPSAADAERVTVRVGQEVNGIVFGLISTRLARVRGRVVGQTASSNRGLVLARQEGGVQFSGIVRPAQIGDNGAFEFAGLAPGRYALQLQNRDQDDMVAMTSVIVAGVDLDGITLAPQPPGVLSGRIEFEGAVPTDLRASQVRVFLNPLDPMSTIMGASRPPETASDFTFQARGVFGPSLVRVDVPGLWYLTAVIANGQDVTDEPMVIPPGSDIRDVRVVLTRAMATVSGTIRDDRGTAILDATAVAFPVDDQKWTFGSRFVRFAKPDTNGRFEITGLPPSPDYRIIAVQGLEEGQAYDPDFLASVQDRAERLSVAAGDVKTMDLRLR